MAQMETLNAVDAAFLHQEGRATHMHIGGCFLLEGPPPGPRDLLAHVRDRLHLVPRYRQRLAEVPAGLGRQRWIDDPSFNLEYHVRHSALPAPGDEAQLRRLVGRLFSQRLDRTKPLWELWAIEGLDDGGWAIVSKVHHALVDGISGVDLMTLLFDLTPEPRAVHADGPWVPRPEPSAAQLAASGVGGAVRAALGLPLRAAAAAARPAATAAAAREAAEGVGEVVWAGLNAAPSGTPLNVPIGPHRRVAFVPTRLEDFKRVKNALGGTVNDVVLAVTAGALRRWMQLRGLRTEGLEVKACVPVSTRGEGDRADPGNRIVQVVVSLPVYAPDPADRLARVREAMAGVKQSKQAAGADIIARAQGFAPPTILAQASRLNFASRFYNLLVTNVPGPQFPLYCLSRRMTATFPVPFLAGERALAVAVMSYDGGLNFGLLGDYDALEDLDSVAAGVRESLDELLALA
jgi:WS/DGAT/MGAT family acyltransferase